MLSEEIQRAEDELNRWRARIPVAVCACTVLLLLGQAFLYNRRYTNHFDRAPVTQARRGRDIFPLVPAGSGQNPASEVSEWHFQSSHAAEMSRKQRRREEPVERDAPMGEEALVTHLRSANALSHSYYTNYPGDAELASVSSSSLHSFILLFLDRQVQRKDPPTIVASSRSRGVAPLLQEPLSRNGV